MSLDSRIASTAYESRRELLNIIKAQRCQLHPQAMQQLVRAAAVVPSTEDRSAFLQNVVSRARFSADRTIELKSALESMSALIPSLQANQAILVTDLPVMQNLASGGNGNIGTQNSSSQQQNLITGTQTQRMVAAAQQAALMSLQPNFRVVNADDIPVVGVDEATCASYRVAPPNQRSIQVRDIAIENEKIRQSQSGGTFAATQQMQNQQASLESIITKRFDSSPRTLAIRTRLALATGKVLRSTRFTAASLLSNFSKSSTSSSSSSESDSSANKFVVYRVSALDGLKNGQLVTLVGVLRFVPWLVGQLQQSKTSSSASSSSSGNLFRQMKAGNGSIGWILEDFTGTIPLLLPRQLVENLSFESIHFPSSSSENQHPPLCSNSLIGDGSIVVCQGNWNGAFVTCRHISLPPSETRTLTQTQVGHIDDFFGLRPSDLLAANRAFHENASANVAILVSDVRISIPTNSSKLLRLMKEFEQRKEEVDLGKVTFVLVGDFVSPDGNAFVSQNSSSSENSSEKNSAAASSSAAAGSNTSGATRSLDASYLSQDRSTISVIQGIDQLGSDVFVGSDSPTPASILTQTFKDFSTQLANQCPNVAANSEFILVPGPTDCCATASGVFPRAPLLSSAVAAFAERCPRTVSAPNPCRLRFLTQEYVLCRAPLHRTFAASSLVTIEGKTNNNNATGATAGAASNKTSSSSKHHSNNNQNQNQNDDSEELVPQRQPFHELAEIVTRESVWFPIPSEGVISLQQGSQYFGFASNSLDQDNSSGNIQNQKENQNQNSSSADNSTKQQPLLLRSWGSVRWGLDRMLYFGGVPHQPHVALMCDDTSCWSCSVDDVLCANSGSFAQSGIFAWISPTDRSVDFNQLPN